MRRAVFNIFAWTNTLFLVCITLSAWGYFSGSRLQVFAQGALFICVYAVLQALKDLIRGRYFCSFVSSVCLVSLVILMVPRNADGILKFDLDASPQKLSQNTIRILQANVWGRNRNFSELDALVEEQKANVVALQECSVACQEGREKRFSKLGFYSVVYKEKRLAVFSKFPILNPQVLDSPPAMHVVLELGKQEKIQLVNVHFTRVWPFEEEHSFHKELMAWKSWLPQLTTSIPALIVGDFNVVPWMSEVRTTMQGNKFDELRSMGVPMGTWPALVPKTELNFPLPFVPIDHTYVRGGIKVLGRSLQGSIGSDHLPVMTSFTLE